MRKNFLYGLGPGLAALTLAAVTIAPSVSADPLPGDPATTPPTLALSGASPTAPAANATPAAGSAPTAGSTPAETAAPGAPPTAPASAATPAAAGATPAVPTTAFSEAQASFNRKDFATAVTQLTAVVTSEPGNADAHNLLAYSLRKTGDPADALLHYRTALQLNPAHRGAHEYLGELYLDMGQPTQAKAQLATLKKLCGGTKCEQYQDLSKAIARYKPAKAAKK